MGMGMSLAPGRLTVRLCQSKTAAAAARPVEGEETVEVARPVAVVVAI